MADTTAVDLDYEQVRLKSETAEHFKSLKDLLGEVAIRMRKSAAAEVLS